MRRWPRFLLCVIGCCAACSTTALIAAEKSAPQQATVLGVLEDFDKLPKGKFQGGFLNSWRWTDEVRSRNSQGSRLEVVEENDGRLLRVQIDDPQLLAGEALPLLRLAPIYPPEADAVRIRLRVASGMVVIYVGGPTAYFGNSDVFTEPQKIVADKEPRWVDVVCNLNHPTWRNFRRASFSTDAPRNYYNRWAQEPLSVFVAAGSSGEFSIDPIEVVALGEGRPFPKFAAEQIRPTKTIADFEDQRLDKTFNLYMADAEIEWFEQSWKREKPLRFAPMQLAVAEAPGGKQALVATGRTAEEVHCTGVRTAGDAQANAFAVTIAADAGEQRNTLLGVGPTAPIDFLVFVAPPAPPFAWDHFAPPQALRALVGPGFHYNFSYTAIRNKPDVSFAIYQTRRYLTPGEWTKLILPAADFTCVFGHGSYRSRLLEHQPLTCDDVVAMAWLRPWCRVGKRDADVATRIDELAFVHIPGTPAEHRSFWQVPDVKALQRRTESSPRGRLLHIALPGDTP